MIVGGQKKDNSGLFFGLIILVLTFLAILGAHR